MSQFSARIVELRGDAIRLKERVMILERKRRVSKRRRKMYKGWGRAYQQAEVFKQLRGE